MIAVGYLISFSPFAWLASAGGGGGDTGGASQQPAVIALVIGVISAVAAGFNIVQQIRRDNKAEKNAASSVINDASKMSFEQVMATSRWQGERLTELQEVLERTEDERDEYKKENQRLRAALESLGGEIT